MNQQAQVQDVSEEYVREYSKIVNVSMWDRAALLSRWKLDTTLTDTEIAAACNDGVTGDWVRKMRQVWQDFAPDRARYPSLSFTHFSQALPWDDAEIWLSMAHRQGLSVKQMVAERTPKSAESTLQPEPSTGASSGKSAEKKQKPPDDAAVPAISGQDEDDDIEYTDAELSDDTADWTHVSKEGSSSPTDKVGTRLPTNLIAIFKASECLAELETDIAALIVKATERGIVLKDINYQYDNRLQMLLNSLASAERELRFTIPYAVCGFCKGAGCRECRSKGWIEQETWKATKGR